MALFSSHYRRHGHTGLVRQVHTHIRGSLSSLLLHAKLSPLGNNPFRRPPPADPKKRTQHLGRSLAGSAAAFGFLSLSLSLLACFIIDHLRRKGEEKEEKEERRGMLPSDPILGP